MSLRDLKNNIIANPVLHSDPADNTAAVGAVQDHRGNKSSTYIIHAGSLVDADATFTALLEESDVSGSGFTPVAMNSCSARKRWRRSSSTVTTR